MARILALPQRLRAARLRGALPRVRGRGLRAAPVQGSTRTAAAEPAVVYEAVLDDDSFNAAANEGIQRYKQAFGAARQAFGPAAIERMARAGHDPAIAIGFALAPEVERVAALFPAVSALVGSTPAAFNDPEQRGHLAIGVDRNQNVLSPGTMLTSMITRIDTAVYLAAIEGPDRRNGGTRPARLSLGLKEQGVGWALDRHNRERRDGGCGK